MTKKNTDPNPTQTYESIKLGIDAHAKWKGKTWSAIQTEAPESSGDWWSTLG